jgi:integrase
MMDMATQPTQLSVMGGTWSTQWYDDSGRRRTKRFGNASKITEKVARRRYQNWLVTWNNDPTVSNPDADRPLLVADVVAKFKEHAATTYVRSDGSPTGETEQVAYALDVLLELFGDVATTDLRPRHLKAFRDRLNEDECARTTINKRVAIVKRCFRWAADEEIVSGEVAAALWSVRPIRKGDPKYTESVPTTPVARCIVELTLTKCPPTLRAMIELQWLTAMRPEEVCIMRTVDIDTSAAPWAYRPAFHKTQRFGVERVLYLGPAAQALVEPYISRDVEAYLFRPQAAMAERNKAKVEAYTPPADAEGDYRQWASYRAKQPKGNARYRPRYDSHSYRHAIHLACDAAGVPRWSPNQLRHAAKMRIERDYGRYGAKAVLGHTREQTTDLYGERDREEAKRIMALVG